MKTETLAEQVVNLIEQNKISSQETKRNLEFVDINKAIETMLTANSSKADKINITLQS